MSWHVRLELLAAPTSKTTRHQTIGERHRLARRRRKLPQRLIAERMLLSVQTLQRLEAGDSTVGLAVRASALFVLGMSSCYAALVAPESDDAGLQQDIARLPRAVHALAHDDLDF